MKLHILLTRKLKDTIPDTIKILICYPNVSVFFPSDKITLEGDNAILEGEAEDFIKWLRSHGDIPVGNGVPQLESFELMKIIDVKTERLIKLNKLNSNDR